MRLTPFQAVPGDAGTCLILSHHASRPVPSAPFRCANGHASLANLADAPAPCPAPRARIRAEHRRCYSTPPVLLMPRHGNQKQSSERAEVEMFPGCFQKALITKITSSVPKTGQSRRLKSQHQRLQHRSPRARSSRSSRACITGRAPGPPTESVRVLSRVCSKLCTLLLGVWCTCAAFAQIVRHPLVNVVDIAGRSVASTSCGARRPCIPVDPGDLP